ncbi:hypothetical protein KOAAANKH_03819 [Brevundimonas sp. NIBR10]|uniref:SDR family NAD(P)-dependent oxidoreductase n=1 Tax=Brevundimonas sp. NIBR10 TaxID=3015997 RepID=UPI0022F1C7A3|nr:SDR family oxidoreductase [Brevundimonas sp. NIBR10]WGM48905.1 hypothetical protein KOAAANKH_03819 [Brevundimonas sp. NIBR10]
MIGQRPGGGRTVLVTGASAGIGAALAWTFVKYGWDAVLTARREPELALLADQLSEIYDARVTVLPCDLAAPGAATALVDQIGALGIQIDALVNNAGFSRTTGFLATDPADHAAMVKVMLSAPIELSRLLIPGMVDRGFGRVLNVASLAGLMPATGGDTLYGPIKGFLIKASAGLHLELEGTGVHVTALCPGYTLTEFHDVNGSREEVSSAYPAWMWQTANQVARVGYAAVEANRARVVPGWRNTLLAAIPKLLPDALALKIIGGHARRLKRI